MHQISLKLMFSIVIFIISVSSGFATLHFVNRYRRLIAMGEALANGIFVGAALFHLMPDAAATFDMCRNCTPLLDTLAITAASFISMMLIEQIVTHRISNYRHISRVAPLLLTLSVHAFITGLALGISHSYVVIISLLIAILAHKSFEMFALVLNLHRRIRRTKYIRILFCIFSFITPLGILLGNSGNFILPLNNDSTLTGVLNAICAGTFLYIATVHAKHNHHPFDDGYYRYKQILATIFGIIAMGVLAFYI